MKLLYLSLFPSWWFGINFSTKKNTNTKWPLCVWWVSQRLSLCVSCHWSSLRSSIRRLNPGEAWSGSASDCWFRHSISLPTCKIPISTHFELKISTTLTSILICFWPDRPCWVPASGGGAPRTCWASPGSGSRCTPAAHAPPSPDIRALRQGSSDHSHLNWQQYLMSTFLVQ